MPVLLAGTASPGHARRAGPSGSRS